MFRLLGGSCCWNGKGEVLAGGVELLLGVLSSLVEARSCLVGNFDGEGSFVWADHLD